MAVYVDDAMIPYGRMRMCHLVADTSGELHAMADRIGVARKYAQQSGTPREHYDICLAKRELAIAAGARECHARFVVGLMHAKRYTEAK